MPGPIADPSTLVLSADLVVPMTAPPILDGAVAVAGGRILHVGTRRWVLDLLREEGRAAAERHVDGVLTPGLVNAHTHLQYTRMAEVGAGSYRGFDDWAVAFSAVYDRGGLDWGAAAAEGARMLLAAGVTVAADIVTDQAAVSALADAGLHGIAYWEVMNWSNAAWRRGGRDQVIAELERVPTTPGSGLSPHAPYSLDAEPLLDIPDIVRAHAGRLHIHLGESHFEGARTSGPEGESHVDWRFAGIESFRVLREQGYGASATEFVDRLGVLGPDCHVAHGVYMTAEDRALLRARGTSVALCPRSNEVIGLEAPPVAAYLTRGQPDRRRHRLAVVDRLARPDGGRRGARAHRPGAGLRGRGPARAAAVRRDLRGRAGDGHRHRPRPARPPRGGGRRGPHGVPDGGRRGGGHARGAGGGGAERAHRGRRRQAAARGPGGGRMTGQARATRRAIDGTVIEELDVPPRAAGAAARAASGGRVVPPHLGRHRDGRDRGGARAWRRRSSCSCCRRARPRRGTRVASDEVWLWHGPDPLVLELGGFGEAPETDERIVLGPGADQEVQVLVPAGTWQRTVPSAGETLVSCVVSPGFDFADFVIRPD